MFLWKVATLLFACDNSLPNSQASGEAEYTGDRPPAVGELHAVCVLSEYARAKITGIDDSKALVSCKFLFGKLMVHMIVSDPVL